MKWKPQTSKTEKIRHRKFTANIVGLLVLFALALIFAAACQASTPTVDYGKALADNPSAAVATRIENVPGAEIAYIANTKEMILKAQSFRGVNDYIVKITKGEVPMAVADKAAAGNGKIDRTAYEKDLTGQMKSDKLKYLKDAAATHTIAAAIPMATTGATIAACASG